MAILHLFPHKEKFMFSRVKNGEIEIERERERKKERRKKRKKEKGDKSWNR